MKTCLKDSKLVKIEERYRALYIMTSVPFVVDDHFNLCVLAKWCQDIGIAEEVKALGERATVLCYTHMACFYFWTLSIVSTFYFLFLSSFLVLLSFLSIDTCF